MSAQMLDQRNLSHVATGRLDTLFANSQFRNMLEWEDPTARSDELTKAGTER
jgi:hypothetical protein